jgi:hypothetical protein
MNRMFQLLAELSASCSHTSIQKLARDLYLPFSYFHNVAQYLLNLLLFSAVEIVSCCSCCLAFSVGTALCSLCIWFSLGPCIVLHLF